MSPAWSFDILYLFVCFFWIPHRTSLLFRCNTVFPFPRLLQTSRRSSHRCEWSAVREQHYALERCYFWVSHALNSTPPCRLCCSTVGCHVPPDHHPPCQSGFNISDCGSELAGKMHTQKVMWGNLSALELLDWIRRWSKQNKKKTPAK